MIITHPINQLRSRRRARAFTMIEIVLSLAVIAVAMVAIIGVLPLGMNVEAENREQSIVNADAALWIEAIRGGAQGMEYLSEAVVDIRVDEARYDLDDGSLISQDTQRPIPTWGEATLSASNIIGLLSYPKVRVDLDANERIVRNVYVDVRAMNGNMGDLNADAEFAFKYRMVPELVYPTANGNGEPERQVLNRNLYELRLHFAWPLIPAYRSQTEFQKELTFRTTIAGGQLVVDRGPSQPPLRFVNPRQFE